VHRGTNATVTVVANLSASGAQVDTAHVQSELPDSDTGNDTGSESFTDFLHVHRYRPFTETFRRFVDS